MAHLLIGEKRDGGISIRSTNGIPRVDETWHYLVKSDSKFATKFSITQTSGLPIVNQTLSSGGISICRTKDAARREGNPYLWDVTCTFSSDVEENSGAGANPSTDPTTWIPVYETRFERLQTVANVDVNGVPIANSAGVAFVSGMTHTRKLPVWEFFQFESSAVTDEQIIDRAESLNNAVFRGRAAKTLLLDVLSSVVGYYYGSLLRFTRYSLTYRIEGWKHRRLDVGSHYLDSGDLKTYLDGDGAVIEGGLDGSGGKVSPGSPPAVLSFDMYPSIAFDFLRV